jgi:hypothetical protein
MAGTSCTYHVLSGAGVYLRRLRGVLNEPQFKSAINGGFAGLVLDLDHFPAELAWGNLVRVNAPAGAELGRFKVEEDATASSPADVGYTLTLTPLVAELTDVSDYTANYTADAAQGSVLGAADPQTWSRDAITRTSHLVEGSIAAVGASSGYAFRDASSRDALEQHVKIGGAGWWWFVDASGLVYVRNTSPVTHTVNEGREAEIGALARDIHSLINTQVVEGQTLAGTTLPLSATAADTNALNPFSIPTLGRRAGRVYRDTGLVALSDVTALATSLLAAGERVNVKRTITLHNYPLRPRCGDAIRWRAAEPDITGRSRSIVGPYLIVEVIEHGTTGTYDLTVTDIAAGIKDQAQYQYDVSVQSATRATPQPASFTSTTVVKPSQIAGAPNVPTGLSASSYLENTAQVENAALLVSWSAPAVDASHDAAAVYQVQYRKTGASNWQSTLQSGASSVAITGLVQGQGYDFQVQAMNAGGSSGWTATATQTTATSSAPSAPSAPSAAAGVSTAVVSWPLLAAADVQLYEVWQFVGASVASTPPGGSTLAWSGTAAAAAISGLTSNQVYTFWVRAKNWSGNLGTYSAYVQATPRYVGNADIAAASIIVDKLSAGTLSAAVILSGSIKTAATVDSTHAGILLDATSLRIYDGTGTNWGAPAGAGVAVELNPTTAFFKGTIRGSLIQGPSGSPGGTSFLEIDMTLQTGLKLRVNDGTLDRVIVGFY